MNETPVAIKEEELNKLIEEKIFGTVLFDNVVARPFSSDIGHAFLIVEKLKDECGWIDLTYYGFEPSHIKIPESEVRHWLCTFKDKNKKEMKYVFGKTVLEAICLAALMFKGVEINGQSKA